MIGCLSTEPQPHRQFVAIVWQAVRFEVKCPATLPAQYHVGGVFLPHLHSAYRHARANHLLGTMQKELWIASSKVTMK